MPYECAYEGGVCECSGDIVYSAESNGDADAAVASGAYALITGFGSSTTCDNNAAGSDPAPGQVKACWCVEAGTVAEPTRDEPTPEPTPEPGSTAPAFQTTWNAQEIYDTWTQVSGRIVSESLPAWTHLGGGCGSLVQHKRSPLLAIDSMTGVSRSDFLYVTVESYPQNWGNANPMRLTARVVTADGALGDPAPWAERDRIGKYNNPDESSWVNNTFELVDPGGDLYIDVYVSEVGNCFGIRSITVSSEP